MLFVHVLKVMVMSQYLYGPIARPLNGKPLKKPLVPVDHIKVVGSILGQKVNATSFTILGRPSRALNEASIPQVCLLFRWRNPHQSRSMFL
jgi:hypothetical protein